MSVVRVADAGLRIDEEIVFLDVEVLVCVLTVGVTYKAVVDAVRSVVDVAHLQVYEVIPSGAELIVGLNECAPVVLVSVRVVILILSVAEILLLYSLVGDVCHVAPVVAAEELHAGTSDNVPCTVSVGYVIECAVIVLCKTLLTDGVRLGVLCLAAVVDVCLVDTEL